MKVRSTFFVFIYLFAYRGPIVSTPLIVEMTVITPPNCFWIFVKNRCLYVCGALSGLCLVSLMCMAITQHHTVLITMANIVSLTIRQ